MRFNLVLLLGVFLLAGCGGGGGGGSSSAPPPPAPSSSAAADSATVDEESSVSIDVTSNDTDVDSSTLSVASGAANGTVDLDGSTFTYTPAADFSGTDSFRYGVTGNDGTSLQATVTITVTDINDPPVAADDVFTLVENNTLTLSLQANDTDIDDAISAFEIDGSFQGTVSGEGASLTYTPPADFTGNVSFDYRAVDERGGVSNTASVSITVEAVSLTTMLVEPLTLPQAGYVAASDAELGQTVLMSPEQEFVVPPNVISVLLSLTGPDANIEENGLFISSITPPSGPFVVYQRLVHFCFGGSCTGLVPRAPGVVPESGNWRFTLGTLAGDLEGIDFSKLSLTVTVRTGPDPDVTAPVAAKLRINPVLTADTVSVEEVQTILGWMEDIAVANNFELVIDPVIELTDPAFTSVSSSFLDETTAALVSQGNPDAVNLFFLESFSNTDTVAGISGGIPGSLGVSDPHNGVLVNATGFRGGTDVFYVQNTAETAFHEMGHLLGLYHTTEAQFSFHDVIDDTPICEASVHDTNDDGVAGSNECPDAQNPMFWQNSVLTEWQSLTEGQQHVIIHSPLAVPGS